MEIRRNVKATAAYEAASNASIIADFALDMLASALRTGMDTHTTSFESLRLNAIAAIEKAQDALDFVNRTDAAKAYIDRYNHIIDAA